MRVATEQARNKGALTGACFLELEAQPPELGVDFFNTFQESSRHFRLACRAYQSLGSPVLGALSGVAAAAAPADCRDSGFPERIQEAFGELAAVDAECAQRLVPAMDHDLEVYRVVREVIAGGAVPTALPEPVTEDDLHLVRSAKVDSLDQPERAVAIARWIQSLRGLGVHGIATADPRLFAPN